AFRLAARLRETLAELRRTREERYRVEALHRTEMRSLQDRAAELKARKESLQARMASLREEIEKTKRAVADHQKETVRIQAVLAKARTAIDAAAKQLRDWITRSIPFRLSERLATLEAFLEKRDEGPPQDRVRRLHKILEYEIVLGSTSEAYRSRITLGENRIPRARCMRLGTVTIAFITEDGKTAGILAENRDGNPTWKTDLGFWERWALKRGLEILERRRPPVFIRFPMNFDALRPQAKSREGKSAEREKDGTGE
ncbi:MAG: DUF3450 family protein, partial [Planctomycetota bacterium]